MPGLWLIVACADPVDAFVVARAEAVCARHDRCGTLAAAGFTDEADCLAALLGAARTAKRAPCRGYADAAADACLAAWDETACEDVPELSVCDDVCR
ncbi:MAG: hypothetical protein ACOZNI_21605 [Myxococcota bacterium]